MMSNIMSIVRKVNSWANSSKLPSIIAAVRKLNHRKLIGAKDFQHLINELQTFIDSLLPTRLQKTETHASNILCVTRITNFWITNEMGDAKENAVNCKKYSSCPRCTEEIQAVPEC